jgi:glycosyltransferase involved in cell wall biosynthesis
MDTPNIIAVIPAFNEELTISSLVLLTIPFVTKVIVIDDGSTDKTNQLATAVGAEVIRSEKNLGKANALMKGLKKARDFNPDAVVMVDADGQHNPAEIPTVIKPVIEGKADLVIGSRFLETKNKVPKFRRIGQKSMDYAQNIGASFKTSDSQSGFRALSKKALENLDFFSEGYNIESDMINHFHERGLSIHEVPITVRYDVPFKHKQNPLEHGWGLISNIVGFIGYRRPLLLFGVPGAFFTAAGIILGFWAFHIYDTTAKFPMSYSMMSVLLIISGLLLLTSGLILNTLVIIVKSES